jgi:hypothetical protein
VYTNPDHSLRFNGQGSMRNPGLDRFFNALPQDTKVRATAGAGTAVGSRLQLDAAYSSTAGLLVPADRCRRPPCEPLLYRLLVKRAVARLRPNHAKILLRRSHFLDDG